jgi:pyrroloquinoline quinone biosynthesis protein D
MNGKEARGASKVRLAPGRHVRRERHQHILVNPAGTVQLNETAAEILSLCDCTRTREEIIAQIRPRAISGDIAVDVNEFLDAARQRGWIIEV